MINRIYLDYASSTPVDRRVLSAMEPYWQEIFANPWSAHSEGEKALVALHNAQEVAAKALGIEGVVTDREIVFTSSGTESNTLALKGALDYVENRRGSLAGLHILVGDIEHPSVRDIGSYAQEKGIDVEYVPITADGIVDISYIKAHIRPETALISIQYVNSEIGTIQPIEAISKVIKDFKRDKGAAIVDHDENVLYPLFHTDASQAFTWLSIDAKKLGIDMLTMDAHKMYGPKGIGLLYIRKGTPIKGLFLGSDEKSYRPGTPAIPLIVGFAEAIKIIEEDREKYVANVLTERNYLIHAIQENFPHARINGSWDTDNRVANNVSVTFPGINHEFLQVQLDQRGICVATKSACLEEGGEGSYVIDALQKSSGNENASYTSKNALRITLGKDTSRDHIEILLKTLKEFITS